MKRILTLAILACMACLSASSQEIYKEVVRLMDNAEALKNDTTKSMDARLIATFKADAIYYMITKASDDPTFTELELGTQTSAMIEFVNLYIKRLAAARRKDAKVAVQNRFSNATTRNPLFNDVDKEVIYAYVGNNRYLTQFSIDTDWVKALAEVK
ncbi:MAG: hypothetical protein IJ196_00295 [Prevotella sp.]|nr:hypothetical protein [Prevotella sp.]